MTIFSLYPLARRALFALDAEHAHDLTLGTLNRLSALGLLPQACPLPGRPVRLAGLEFRNPVGLAAGLDKNAGHLDALASFGFGFMEVGTVTPRAQTGNPKPRMFRLPEHEALINRLGFNNQGLDVFLEHVGRSAWVREKRGVLGLNIGKNADTPIDRADDDYSTCLKAVYPYADYVTVNISSPNTKDLRELQGETLFHGLFTRLKREQASLAAQHGRRVPLFVKIAPDLDDDQLDTLVRSIRTHEIEGVVATNTTLSRHAVAGSAHAHEAGGLSGAPLLGPSNRITAQLRSAIGADIPIIGVGGILSGEDARLKLASGADLVQVYTGLIYCGPALVREAILATRSA